MAVPKEAMAKQVSSQDTSNAVKVLDTGIIVTETGNSSSITLPSSTMTYKPGKNTDIDSVVSYKAKDSVRLKLKDKVMYLRGETTMDYKEQHLSSEIQIINFNTSILDAYGVKDTSGNITGFPKFKDKGESYVGEKILYNFKTSQGTISLGETEMSEGFYFGSKIKRISQTELFVKDGCYTTCDEAHPHFYFGSPEMKVIASDKIFLDPLIFYVQDMPVFILPIGLYFPNKSGRQSGLMIPSFYFSDTRGVVLQNLGLYLALSDYYDTQFNVDIFSKGGIMVKNSTRWKLLDVFDGSLNIEYGKTKYNPDEKYKTNHKFALRHNQTIDPQSRITANMNFVSEDYNKNTVQLGSALFTTNVTSNASYTKSFDNGSSVSLAFSREQEINSGTWRQTFPTLNFSLPQLHPLKSIVPAGTWLPDWARDLSFSYSGSANYYYEHIRQDDTTTTWFKDSFRSSISHNPSISISPKLGYFTFTPYLSFNAKNYFRRIDKRYNASDSAVISDTSNGFYTEYNYSLGVDLNTRLFGVMSPKIWGINAVRHTFQPNIGLSYSPDLSSESNGFYGYYIDEAKSDTVQYSRFAADGGGIASKYKSMSLRYGLLNNFEAKIFQGDTVQDKNIEFFRWNLNGSYDMTRDSFQFSDVAMQFRIPVLSTINMTASANFSLYDQTKSWNEEDSAFTGPLIRINKLLIDNGKGLMRMTNLNIQFSTSISSEGYKGSPSYGDAESGSGDGLGMNSTDLMDSTTKKPKAGLGDRFKQRYEYEEEAFDMYGDNTPGFSPINIPWNMSFGLSYQNSEPFEKKDQRINLTTSFSFKLTDTWSFNGSAQFDFVNHKLLAPNLNITKDIHCWQLTFQWWPIGYNSGFYLRFSIKAPQLSDLKIEKQSSPILR